MHFTKTLAILALPLLAIAAPTPSDTEMTKLASSVSVNTATLRDLQQRLYDAQGQITVILENVIGASNAVVGQWSGAAAESFKNTLNQYQSDQTRAIEDLVVLAKAVGESADSYKNEESANREIWG
ncbi:hypothetical protein V500_09735 [Pseudogymnoascus sp. VKM F-4518 (FW-2643)]|nr:hypothetical protein V500_09735 [Pseudogymnoascus sp. VKM F-4518 (FW-2643)]